MEAESQEVTIDAVRARVFSALRLLEFHPAVRESQIEGIKLILGSFSLSDLLDFESRYNALDANSQEYVSDVLTGYSSSSFSRSNRKLDDRLRAYIFASTVAAHIFSGYDGRLSVSTAVAYAESISLHVSHAYKMAPETINWGNREITHYSMGAALIVISGRMDATPFENVLWLGRNHQKLLPLLGRISEVSAERSYLEPLLEGRNNPLTEGAI